MTDDPDHPYAAFALALQQAWRQKPNVAASAVAALDMIEAALSDTRFTSVEMLREAVRRRSLAVPTPGARRHPTAPYPKLVGHRGGQLVVATSRRRDRGRAWRSVSCRGCAVAGDTCRLRRGRRTSQGSDQAGDNVVELPSGVRVRREKGKP